MSRCVLDDERRGFEVVIGWDPPMQTFFARVFSRSAFPADAALGKEDPGRLFWTGCGDRDWRTPADLDELTARVQPYACPHDRGVLREELLADQENNDERTYDLYDGSDGWPGDELPADWKPLEVGSDRLS